MNALVTQSDFSGCSKAHKNERSAAVIAAVERPQAGGPGAGGTVAVEGVGKGEDSGKEKVATFQLSSGHIQGDHPITSETISC